MRKKSFIITTILTPLGFVLLFAAVIFIMTSGAEQLHLAVYDEADILELQSKERNLPDANSLRFSSVSSETKLEELKKNYKDAGYSAILYLPAPSNERPLAEQRNLEVQFLSEERLGLQTKNRIESIIAESAKQLKIKQSGIDKQLLESFETAINLNPVDLKQEGAEAEEGAGAKVYLAAALGGIMIFLMYIVIFIYGNMVMRSVMEEKTNRIVEVIISSVRPFQLMMGKVLAMGAVGLTQFFIWAITVPLLYLLVGLLFAPRLQNIQADQVADAPDAAKMAQMLDAMEAFKSFDYGYIFAMFLLFFIGGYILYASLFAAIGAAMGDDWGEGQGLTLIVSIPIIIGFYIGAAAVENPNGSLAIFGSLFPLFSPMVMPARLVFDPPLWQLAASLGLLLLNCILFVWISARIYRVGILMYGKKVTTLEFLRWMFRSE